jgi:class 3 adenylate cyclase
MSKDDKKDAYLLFADIKGSSRLDHGELWRFKKFVEPELFEVISVAIRKELDKSLINSDSGPIYEYNIWGDGYFFAFQSRDDCIRSAFAMRDFFDDYDFRAKGIISELQIRCAIHFGYVSQVKYEDPISKKERDTITGEDLIVAARLEPVTPPQRIWCTDKFFKVMEGNHIFDKDFGNECMGTRQLAKGWGAMTLHDLRLKRELPFEYPKNKTLEELNEESSFISVKLKKKEGDQITKERCEVTIDYEGSSKETIESYLERADEWSEKISEMYGFLETRQACEIDVAISVGIQNFILYKDKLLAGIRKKSKNILVKDSGLKIGRGTLDTGYKAITNIEVLENIVISSDPQDLFKRCQNKKFAKNGVRCGQEKLNNLIGMVAKQISSRAKRARQIFSFGTEVNRIALFFINKSRIVPRFEIGICNFMVVTENDFKDGFIESFGYDEYLHTDEEENYWLWICDGKIHARTIPTAFGIPNREVWKNFVGKKNLLVNNDIEEFGFLEKYIPVVSDEALSNDQEVFHSMPLSSPARSLLEIF